ncbi:MAG TPA: phospholipase D-like domain-containing protein [Thermoanaerobaculia bacterium]|nr:phospholipase D-like domain-containing protein [Thermoanaerobaculia bacterium]
MGKRKRPRLWKARLRPLPRRRLPPELRPGRIGEIARRYEGLADPGFPTLLSRVDQTAVLGGNCVDVYFDGASAFQAMERDVDGARTEVLVESYIWKDDSTGARALDALGRAAARGVAVRALADAVGSWTTKKTYWDEMRRRGIEVRLFGPFLLQPFRDHRKILVVDRRIAYSGGMNIADEYSGGSGAGSGGKENLAWRDTHARVEGAAAWEMATVFSEGWNDAKGTPLDLQPLEPPPDAPARVLVLDSRPGRGHEETASVLAAVVAAARERIWITNAYFAPRRHAIRALAGAVSRGVDVRLLLPGVSDVPIVRHAGHGWYGPLRDAGVRVFEYQPAILHAKTAVADDYVSVVGSTNLDFRSFHLNAECNFLVLDADVGETMSRAFERDLESSREIDGTWHRSFVHLAGDHAARKMGIVL